MASQPKPKPKPIIPIWFARLIAIAALSGCLYTGLQGTHINGINNGFYESLSRIIGRNADELYVPGGPGPYTWTYTGMERVDRQLRILVAFFAGFIHGNGDTVLGVVSKYLVLQFSAGWVLVSLEGVRAGHRGRWLSWTGIMGFIFQNAAYTNTIPIWLALHLLTSPTAKTKSISSSTVAGDPVSTKILPLCVLIGFGIPTIAMSLPSPGVLSAPVHYAWIAIWQLFPIWQSLVLMILRPLVSAISSPSTKASQRSAVATVYKLVLGLATLSQLSVLLLALIPESAIPKSILPTLPPSLVEILREVDFYNTFIPAWVSNPPSFDPKSVEVIPTTWLAPLAVHFLQWDIYCGNLAVFVWSGFLYYVASAASSSDSAGASKTMSSGVKVVGKAVGWFVFGGPIAAAAYLLWERDEGVYGRELLAEGKKAL